MRDYSVKPTNSLIIRNYFVIFTTFVPLFLLGNDGSLFNSGEGIFYFVISVVIQAFLLIVSHIKIDVFGDRIEFSIFGVKTRKLSRSKIKIIQNKMILNSLKARDAMLVQAGYFYFTISDLWKNYNLLKSDVSNKRTT